MKNINKISLAGGLLFAALDVVCAIIVAFALEPFVAFWSYVSHVRFVGLQMEGSVTLGSLVSGAIFFFALGYVLTWFFIWMLGKTSCCKQGGE